MTTSIADILTQDELDFILAMPEVQAAQSRLSGSHMVYFNITLPDEIKASLVTRLGLDLTTVAKVPMRWVKGDTGPHIDRGAGEFENTYLMYLTDSPGELIVGGETYPIAKNTAYVFNEGVNHETQHTGSTERLMLGPMSEQGFSVGFLGIIYFPSQADAQAFTNQLGNTSSFLVGAVDSGTTGGFTSWRIQPTTSYGPDANSTLVYSNGDILNNSGGSGYSLYPSAPCFLEGTKILCEVDGKEAEVPVQDLRQDMLVKTHLHGLKKVTLVGHGQIYNPANKDRLDGRLYRCTKEQYPSLKEDLIITGDHSILIKTLKHVEYARIVERLGNIYVTDDMYRIPAAADHRAEPYEQEGTFKIWNFCLESDSDSINYGVYANGLLVESCFPKFMKTKSNMTFI